MENGSAPLSRCADESVRPEKIHSSPTHPGGKSENSISHSHDKENESELIRSQGNNTNINSRTATELCGIGSQFTGCTADIDHDAIEMDILKSCEQSNGSKLSSSSVSPHHSWKHEWSPEDLDSIRDSCGVSQNDSIIANGRSSPSNV